MGMMAVIFFLKTNALRVRVWKCRLCVTLWTCLPRDLENPLERLPEHPSTSLCSFVQATTQAGSDINGSKLKICRRTGCLGWPGDSVCTGGCLGTGSTKVMLTEGCRGRAPHRRDTQTYWRLSESPAGWLLWFRHFHSCKFRYGAILCPPPSPPPPSHAAHSRGDGTYCANLTNRFGVALMRRGVCWCDGTEHTTV